MAGLSGWNFFDPGSTYGGTYAPGIGHGSFATSPAGTQYFNANPGTWFDRQTAGFGSDTSAFGRFVQSRRSPWIGGYNAALGTNPNLTVPQYGGNGLSEQYFRGLFSNLAPSQRGESSSLYGGGRLRWIL